MADTKEARCFARSIGSGVVSMALACILAGLCGCHSSSKGGAASNTVASSQKQYSVRGKVIAVDAKGGVISLDTEAIPNFMEAMTMGYTLENPSEASGLHPGDVITAELQITGQGAVLSDIDVLKQANLNIKPAAKYHFPSPGEKVPNFKLRNQSDREIHLDQFRGKVLVLTFIYTRCQSSKYCPLMSRDFAKLNQMLAADPKLSAKTHLLSISFDPKYDTPAVLRSYGGAYTGRYTQEKFEHWDFAAPSEAELASVIHWFGVGVTSTDGKILQHSLSTAVVGPDGKIRDWYPTNTWTPNQLLQDVQQILAKGK